MTCRLFSQHFEVFSRCNMTLLRPLIIFIYLFSYPTLIPFCKSCHSFTLSKFIRGPTAHFRPSVGSSGPGDGVKIMRLLGNLMYPRSKLSTPSNKSSTQFLDFNKTFFNFTATIIKSASLLCCQIKHGVWFVFVYLRWDVCQCVRAWMSDCSIRQQAVGRFRCPQSENLLQTQTHTHFCWLNRVRVNTHIHAHTRTQCEQTHTRMVGRQAVKGGSTLAEKGTTTNPWSQAETHIKLIHHENARFPLRFFFFFF